jgi:hypothetical protein
LTGPRSWTLSPTPFPRPRNPVWPAGTLPTGGHGTGLPSVRGEPNEARSARDRGRRRRRQDGLCRRHHAAARPGPGRHRGTSTKTPTTISWPAALGPWQVVRHRSGAAAPGLGWRPGRRYPFPVGPDHLGTHPAADHAAGRASFCLTSRWARSRPRSPLATSATTTGSWGVGGGGSLLARPARRRRSGSWPRRSRSWMSTSSFSTPLSPT